jgi:hypothetical protein
LLSAPGEVAAHAHALLGSIHLDDTDYTAAAEHLRAALRHADTLPRAQEASVRSLAP